MYNFYVYHSTYVFHLANYLISVMLNCYIYIMHIFIIFDTRYWTQHGLICIRGKLVTETQTLKHCKLALVWLC